jgi:RNA polymerase sigma-32 factor
MAPRKPNKPASAKPRTPTRKSVPRDASKARVPEVLPAELEPEEEETEEAEESSEEPDEAEISSSLPARAGTDLEVAEIGEDEIPGSRAVSASDPLRRYFDEVKRHPMLDPREEYDLAVQLHQSGELNAAKRLVTANLRLVVKIAMEYRSMYANVMDLIQEGNIGLMKAVSKFDPTKGARLGYYASWWIRSYILKYLLDNFRLVKIGTTQAQKKLFYHLVREKERLEAQGLLAGPKLLAEKLNVREKDVVEMEQRLSGRGAEMSLDTPVDSGDERSVAHRDLIADSGEAADESLARSQLLALLKEKLPEFESRLNDKERKILRERLLADEPKTLQEVADSYGLTRERARQIEAKVIEKLREFLRPSL